MKKLISILLAVATVFCLSACVKTENSKITIVLDWTPNTNHTGIFVAEANGYFEQAGLDVEIVQSAEGSAETLVATGKAQFGVSFQDTIAPAFVGEDAIPVTAVAAVIQHNTSGIISRKGEGMDTPKGLEGKKYATWEEAVAADDVIFDVLSDNTYFNSWAKGSSYSSYFEEGGEGTGWAWLITGLGAGPLHSIRLFQHHLLMWLQLFCSLRFLCI